MSLVVAPRFPTVARRIRVMLVDDAVVIRGLFARWVESEPDLDVVATLRTGREAVNQLERGDPDVVVLDVDMPELDGITALPLLLEKRHDLVVIMASTLTRRNAEISLRALSLGAADYIPKPESTREITNATAFRRELIDKIRALGARRKRQQPPRVPPVAANPAAVRQVTSPPLAPVEHPPIKLRPFPALPPRVLLIGSSTGGPQALNAVVGRLNGLVDDTPVLLVQHMPPTF